MQQHIKLCGSYSTLCPCGSCSMAFLFISQYGIVLLFCEVHINSSVASHIYASYYIIVASLCIELNYNDIITSLLGTSHLYCSGIILSLLCASYLYASYYMVVESFYPYGGIATIYSGFTLYLQLDITMTLRLNIIQWLTY